MLTFELIKSNRKTYAIQIKADGSVTVRTPLRVSEHFLKELMIEKEKWIIENQNNQKKRHDKTPKSNLSEEQRNALEKRYRQAAKEYIPKRIQVFLPLTGGEYQQIAIRDQKTRWGSCSSNRTLSFNWKLMLAPPKVLDYVIVHELCHLSHMNHSKDFWKLVETVLPDYKESKKWLKENGQTLQL